MNYFLIPLLLTALIFLTGFNALVGMAIFVFQKGLKGMLLISACLAALTFCSGCTTQDMQASMQLTSIGANTVELLQTWPGNKAALEKYRDMLPNDDLDYKLLDELIEVGETVHQDLKLLANGQHISSVSNIKYLFIATDSAVQSGKILYDKYSSYISPHDKFRARMFSGTWGQIQANVLNLNTQTSKEDKYQLTKEILTFVLQIAGQVVIPSLQAAGKI